MDQHSKDELHAEQLASQQREVRYSHADEHSQASWYTAIIDGIPDPVMVVNVDGVVRLCNAAALALLGDGAGSLAGRSLRDLTGMAELAGALSSAETAPESWPAADIVLGDGLVFAPHIAALPSAGDAREGWVLTLHDVSAFKRVHASMSDFLGTVSHDLRSPLTFMRGYVDMLGMVGELNERQAGFASKISDGITQMADIVEKVLEAGKLDPETGNYQLMREVTDLHDVVRQIADKLAEAAAAKRLDFRCSIADDVPVVAVDRAMVQIAFTNLVENAVKYTPEGGSIEIELRRDGSQILFRVTDDGFGIHPEDQARIFDRHVRVRRQEWNRVKGSGLGLFIVKRVAQRHGGDAWVESEIDAGSSFFVAIPLSSTNLTGAPGG